MPTPESGPTSAQFRPNLGAPVFDGQIVPLATYGMLSSLPEVTYTVQDGDTVSEVARILYGANTSRNRSKVLHNGFYPGAVHTVNAYPRTK